VPHVAKTSSTATPTLPIFLPQSCSTSPPSPCPHLLPVLAQLRRARLSLSLSPKNDRLPEATSSPCHSPPSAHGEPPLPSSLPPLFPPPLIALGVAAACHGRGLVEPARAPRAPVARSAVAESPPPFIGVAQPFRVVRSALALPSDVVSLRSPFAVCPRLTIAAIMLGCSQASTKDRRRAIHVRT
jgi:hypothetical protein